MRRLLPLLLLALASCASGGGLRAVPQPPAAAQLGEEAARLDAVLRLESSMDKPLAAFSVQYDLLLFGQPVAVGSTAVGGATGVIVPAGGSALLQLPIRIPYGDLPAAVATRLQESGSVPATVRGRIYLRKAEQHALVELPFELEATLTAR